jgi:hypothetical protein
VSVPEHGSGWLPGGRSHGPDTARPLLPRGSGSLVPLAGKPLDADGHDGHAGRRASRWLRPLRGTAGAGADRRPHQAPPRASS